MHPSIEVLTPPDAEPVEAAELAAHLRLNTGTAEYEALDAFIRSARELFERSTGRAVLPTQFRQWLPRFCAPVDLLRGPVTAIDAVGYLDADGDEQALDGEEGEYAADLTGIPAVVYVPDGAYPVLHADTLRPAWIDFTAGWEASSGGNEVPEVVVTAIKLLAAHYYRFRESYTEAPLRDLPQGFQAVVNLYDTGLTRGG
jgi:uncharacterized phiE125 gp8 family phage protein